MFINIDELKKPQEPKFFLARPSLEVIGSLNECYNDSGNFKLGNVGEISLTVPYYIEENHLLIKNENVDKVREKMLIKMVLGTQVEWYIIDSIDDEGEEVEMIINAYSLPYELTHKAIIEYKNDSATAREFLTEILQETIWKIGTMDAKFDNIYRSFEIADSNVLESILEGAESYDALVKWDNANRTISFLDFKTNGKYNGMTVNYGELLTSFSRNRSTDEMVTRYYPEGSEGLTIHRVNPTGQGYIEDFSFFTYPFERDANGRVIKSSDFMSDELCIALENLSELSKDFGNNFKELTDERADLQVDYIVIESELKEMQGNLENLEYELDTAKAIGGEELINELNDAIDTASAEIETVTSNLESIGTQMASIDAQIDTLNRQLQIDASFTPDLLYELNPYIIQRFMQDDRYIDDQDLYDSALEKFEELRKPKIVITVGLENLLESVEEQYYWDKLVLGDLIRIKYPQMNIYYEAKIVEIDYNFEDGDISITIANTAEIDSSGGLNELLGSSQTASTLIQNNKYKWDKVGEIEDEVYKLLNEEWDASKRRIIAGVDNLIEIGKRGIVATSPTYPNEVVIIQSGIIALSENKGDTWKTAITAKGIIADRLMGNVLISRNLVMTNANGDFTFDESGLKINANKMNFKNPDGSYRTFSDIEAGIEGKITNVGSSLTQTASEIRQEVNGKITTVNGSITTLTSSMSTALGRIDLVVSSSNSIKADAIASSIALTPSAINIISQNINISGKVTFNSFDSSTQSKINNIESTANSASSTASTANSNANTAIANASSALSTLNSLYSYNPYAGKTVIDGNKIYTDSLSSISANLGSVSVGTLTSSDGRTSFAMSGGTMTIRNLSNSETVVISPSGITGYNSGGSSKFSMDSTLVRSTALASSNSNVYLGTINGGEVRCVNASSLPSDGSVGNYSYQNLRAFNVYANGFYVGNPASANSGSNYFSPVATQGYVDSNFVSNYTWLNASFATQRWVTDQGYVNSYYVHSQGWVTQNWIDNNVYTSRGVIVSSPTYNNTYGEIAHVGVTSSGTFGRITSALKYKTDIEIVDERKYPKILNLNPKSWYDKRMVETVAKQLTMISDTDINGQKKKCEDVSNEVDIPYLKRINGLVAEDLIEAGLEDYVIYGVADENGNREVEGISYDRLWTLLIPLVKEQREEIESIKSEIAELKELIKSKL